MKAIVLEKAGGVENLKMSEIDKPTVKDNEVLIEVKSIGVNPVDYKVRGNEEVLAMIQGGSTPTIIGWDVAGTVAAAGSNVNTFKTGDRVFGMINFPGAGSAYAEYVVAREDHIAIIPEGISFEQAAASTLAALTALKVLESRVKANDRVLIHAGSGGVGHFAIQIAKTLGAHVISTSSGKNKDFVMELGADEFIDYRTQAFQDILSEIDFVFDMFNGEILLNSISVLKVGGNVLSLPTPEFSEEIQEKAKSKNINLEFLLVQSSGRDMSKIADLLKSGKIKPHVSETFTFDNMAKAHLHLESGRTVGKIVVTV